MNTKALRPALAALLLSATAPGFAGQASTDPAPALPADGARPTSGDATGPERGSLAYRSPALAHARHRIEVIESRDIRNSGAPELATALRRLSPRFGL